MRAADVMTPDPVCISPDASITEAIRLVLERKFSALPVVDARGALIGIVREGEATGRADERCLDSGADLCGTQGSAVGPCESRQCRGPQRGPAPVGHVAG